jgi:uncharacterized membrane protein YkvA (DUF1232 family)
MSDREIASIMPSSMETLSPPDFEFVSATVELAVQMHVAANSETISRRKPELSLARHEPMPDSKLAVKDKLVASTVAFVLDIAFLYRLLRHPDTRWYAKGMLCLPVMYLCSPIQLIPSFIPVIGQLDDVFVIWIAKKLAVKFVDVKTHRECIDGAASMKFFLVKRVTNFISIIFPGPASSARVASLDGEELKVREATSI